MRTGRLLLAVLSLAALAAAPSARADADPASDVLYTQDVFLPYGNVVPGSVGRKLTDEIAEANRSGYRVKVAVIGSKNDLGLVQALWLRPQEYAPFLGRELLFTYHDTLLVVMPNGFGVFRNNESVSREERILRRIEIEPGGRGLAQAAGVAVRRLAAAAGHPLGSGSGDSAWLERLVIAGGAAVLLTALVLFGRESRRRRLSAAEP